jgi:integrase
MPLTARKVETAAPGRHMDGRGLMLYVKVSGARSWVLRYQVAGKRRDLGLGAWPEVTLAMAREKALEARRAISTGRDPIDDRSKQTNCTFRSAADALIESKRDGWKNAKHAAQWVSTLEAYAYPRLAETDTASIDTQDILAVLKPIWTEKPETASRVRQRIEAVLDYASAVGAREGDNPARWKGHLDHLLPKPSKVRAIRHHPALDWRELPSFMRELGWREGMAAKALGFLVLTAARSGEVRGLCWDEIDEAALVWTVPAARMKAGKEHRVPLPRAALALMPEMPDRSGLIFPGGRSFDRPLSDMSLAAVLKRMGRTDLTVHGFRSTFRDWAGESSVFPREVIEAALAHRLRDKAEAAYARGDLFQKRMALMEAWERYALGSEPIKRQPLNAG